MSEDKNRLAVIEGIFKEANKKYACPVCLRSQTSFYTLEDHLSRKDQKENDGLHRKLMEKDLSAFHNNYRDVIKWAAGSGLDRQADRESAFEIKFVVKQGTSKESGSIEMMIRNYLRIAEASGMLFVCPLCLEKSFEYFNTKKELFQDHCRHIGDRKHEDLMSTDPAKVLSSYRAAMNRPGDEKLLLKRNRTGPVSYHPSFAIAEVFRERRFDKAP